MFWTLALITTIENAPFPCNKTELIDYAERSGAPLTVIENLRELEDDGDEYEGLKDIWQDMPIDNEDFGFDEDEN